MRKIMTPEEKQAELNQNLLNAAKKCHTEIVKSLIKAGANVDTQNAFTRTPLHFAAENKNTEIVQKLIEAGADVKLTDRFSTPLDIAKTDDQFYGEFINALAQNIIKKTKANGLTVAMATHHRLGAKSLVQSLIGIQEIREIIFYKLSLGIADDTIPPKHLDAVNGALNALQKNAGPHAAKVTAEKNNTTTQDRSI
ncbi:MAG: ankyrin repeat domain-containing protein [Rickettsiales bacterium]|nr:ankyrin repeat domain-containing protein [Rickettsiales bacterium]